MHAPSIGFLSGRLQHLAVGTSFVLAVVGAARISAAPNEIGRPILRDFPAGKSDMGQTRLTGHDRDWSPSSHQRERTFTGPPAGEYRFEVRGRHAERRLRAPVSLGLSVGAPYWLAMWALLGSVAAGTGLLASVVRLRTRSLRWRAASLEIIVAERTFELTRKNIELVRLHRLECEERIAARLAEDEARLEVLRYQINPHFLFNTLASISAALPAGRSSARTMLERLADFCRLTLHCADGRESATLGEEMRLLSTYLQIEQSRWGDLLDVEIAVDPVLDGERLPPLLLLPLVENALKYGRATSPDRVGLRLAARRENDGALVLEVANTGEWIEPAARKTVSSLGIGLDNLRERLTRHYPRMHQLLVSHADGWVTVTLRLTTHRQEAEDRGQETGGSFASSTVRGGLNPRSPVH